MVGFRGSSMGHATTNSHKFPPKTPIPGDFPHSPPPAPHQRTGVDRRPCRSPQQHNTPESAAPPICGAPPFRRARCRWADKPGSVTAKPKPDDAGPSIWDVRRRTPQAVIPEMLAGRASPFSLSDLAPDGVYLAARVTTGTGELLPHRFTLTALESRSLKVWRSTLCCTCRRLTRPAVSWHPALRCPDFPQRGERSPHPRGHRWPTLLPNLNTQGQKRAPRRAPVSNP